METLTKDQIIEQLKKGAIIRKDGERVTLWKGYGFKEVSLIEFNELLNEKQIACFSMVGSDYYSLTKFQRFV